MTSSTEEAARAHEAQSRLDRAAMYLPGAKPWLAVGEASGSWIHDITGTKYLDFGEGGRISILGHSCAEPTFFLREHLNHYMYPGSDAAAGYVTRYAELLSRRFPSDSEGNPWKVQVCSGVAEARQIVQPLDVVEVRLDFADGAVFDVVRRARERGKLVMVDEVDSGFGRTGHFLGLSRYDLIPDIVLLGPSGGGGLPFAAVVAPGSVFPAEFSAFTSPPVCASALGVLSNMTAQLFAHVTEMGGLLEERIMEVSQQFGNSIRAVEGAGLLRRIILSEPEKAQRFRMECRHKGLIVGPGLLLTPPLTVQADEVEAAVDMMADVFLEWDS